jgi:hypothetical protein
MNADVVVNFITALSDWRDKYLHKVGVPSNFEADWDFVSVVSACESFPPFLPSLNRLYEGASDATYQVMWVLLFNALDDFGIREINEVVRSGSPPDAVPNEQYELAKRKVADEALHSALRIAGLVSFACIVPACHLLTIWIQAGVLTTNGYLVRFCPILH